MGARVAVVGSALALAACGFSAPGAGVDGAVAMVADAMGPDATSVDAPMLDGPSLDAAALDASGCRVWATDFSTDPTLTASTNGFPVWRLRNSTPPLTGWDMGAGMWRSPSGIALDTTPVDSFRGTTHVDISYRDPDADGSVPGDDSADGDIGATLWIDPGGDDATIDQLVFAVDNFEDHQMVTLYTRGDDPEHLTARRKEPMAADAAEFVTLSIDVDAPNHVGRYTINGGSEISFSISENFVTADGRFATLFGYGSKAEFDYVGITTCD